MSDDVISSANVRFATFAPGDVISRQGDKDSPLVLVVSGRVQALQHSEDGREVGIGFARLGDSCGESAILLGTPAIASIVAVTNVLAGLVERTEARRLFSDVSVSKGLLRLLANKVERVVDNQAALTLPNAYSRIYTVILSAFQGSSDEVEPPTELPSQSAIAIAANVSRETVSRAVKTLVSRGAITKEGRRFHVTHRGVLQDACSSFLKPAPSSRTRFSSSQHRRNQKEQPLA